VEKGLRQQTHNPKVRYEQKAYHKTEKYGLLYHTAPLVEADQALLSRIQQAWPPTDPRPYGTVDRLSAELCPLPAEAQYPARR
jgi:hypothetical protein